MSELERWIYDSEDKGIEAMSFSELETVIEKGLPIFMQVGRALMRIRDERLYKTDYSNFDAYCRERWQRRRAWADQTIRSTRVAGELHTAGVHFPTEREARAIAPHVEEVKERIEAGEEPESVISDIRGRKPEPPASRKPPQIVERTDYALAVAAILTGNNAECEKALNMLKSATEPKPETVGLIGLLATRARELADDIYDVAASFGRDLSEEMDKLTEEAHKNG